MAAIIKINSQNISPAQVKKLLEENREKLVIEDICYSLLCHFSEKNATNKEIMKILLSNIKKAKIPSAVDFLSRTVSIWAIEFYPELIVPILKNSSNKGIEYLILDRIAEIDDQKKVEDIVFDLVKQDRIGWATEVAQKLPEETNLKLAKEYPMATSEIFHYRPDMLEKLARLSPSCAQNLLKNASRLTEEQKKEIRSFYTIS